MKTLSGETSSFWKRLPFCALAEWFIVFAACICAISCSKTKDGESIVVTEQSGDGYAIVTEVYVPVPANPPGIILVHRYGGDRSLWKQAATLLQHRGVMVAVVDLRGHGESAKKSGEHVNYRQLPEDAWMEALHDIGVARQVLLKQGADPDNLAIAGEGLGANLALHYALEEPAMQGVVMISAGLESNGITTEDAIQKLDDCPTLLMASEGDAYAATSASALNQAAPVFSELRTWSGSAHGVDLFVAHPEAVEFMLEWLMTIFKGKTPP